MIAVELFQRKAMLIDLLHFVSTKCFAVTIYPNSPNISLMTLLSYNWDPVNLSFSVMGDWWFWFRWGVGDCSKGHLGDCLNPTVGKDKGSSEVHNLPISSLPSSPIFLCTMDVRQPELILWPCPIDHTFILLSSEIFRKWLEMEKRRGMVLFSDFHRKPILYSWGILKETSKKFSITL